GSGSPPQTRTCIVTVAPGTFVVTRIGHFDGSSAGGVVSDSSVFASAPRFRVATRGVSVFDSDDDLAATSSVFVFVETVPVLGANTNHANAPSSSAATTSNARR